MRSGCVGVAIVSGFDDIVEMVFFRVVIVFKLQQKQMKSFRGEGMAAEQQQSKTYDKSDCQLTEFPIIKLHILQHIRTLNLSHNLICDLTPIRTHLTTSHHVLAQLTNVDLSYNQLPTPAVLLPLAQAAASLKQLRLTGNPLTRTLNFLYQVILLFRELSEVTHSHTLYVDHDFRVKVVEYQLKGGQLLHLFMQRIYALTKHSAQIGKDYEYLQGVRSIFGSLQQHQQSILEHNQILFQTISRFLEVSANCTINTDQRYQSPVMVRQNRQIDMVSEYKISGRSNHLTRYFSEESQHPELFHPSLSQSQQKDFAHFYYSALLQSKPIQLRLLEEIQVDQEENERLEKGQCQHFDKDVLQRELQVKWKRQEQLTYSQYPQISPTNIPSLATSPFKSIQTQTSTQRDFMFSPSRKHSKSMAFFGLQREWTLATHQFIMHRMLSFMKHLGASNLTSHNPTNHNPTNHNPTKHNSSQTYPNTQTHRVQLQAYVQNDQQPQTNHFQQYLTFGHHNQPGNLSKFEISNHSDEDSLDYENEASPKSKNKYILGTCFNILHQLVKKIVFRRIRATFTIKPLQLACLADTIQKIESRILEHSFRKIGKYALFVEYLTTKMNRYRLQKVFKQWKLLKRRKLKLVKALLNRKAKKQSVFMSIIMAQWRVAASHLKLEQNIRKNREMWSVECPLAEISGIVVRSATQHKLQQREHTRQRQNRYGNGTKLRRKEY